MRRLLRAAATACAAVAMVASRADASDFSVAPVSVTLSHANASTVVTVTNRNATLTRFSVAGSAWSQNDDGTMALRKDDDLIVYPAYFVLAPGETARVRIGVTGADRTAERSYRVFIEELAPLESITGGDGVRLHERIGIPVFVTGAPPKVHVGVAAASVHDGRLSVQLRNDGTAHVLASGLVVTARDARGAKLFERSADAWYLLAGGTRTSTLDLPADGCSRTATFEVALHAGDRSFDSTVPSVDVRGCR